jgi:ubiquitin-conjugating enzyme E2 Z
LRIAVIQKLEEQLGILPNGQVEPPVLAWESDIDNDVEEALEKMGDIEKIKFEPFKDLFKRRFLWYYDSYLNTIETFSKKHADGEKFQKMEFEHGGNTMDGSYQYSDLKRRLNLIHHTLHQEMERWSEEGLNAKRREIGVAANLQRQYEQVVEAHKNKAFTLDLELVDGNPFLWQITYFGKPMTHLDGGMFTIRIYLSPRFPDEQPRVKVVTAIYHHRVAKDGTLCYFPKKVEEMKCHIDSIVESLEANDPPYDPRATVHPEAAKLYWGSADDRKIYHRQLRRSVERSMDEFCCG